jgi:galactokinase
MSATKTLPDQLDKIRKAHRNQFGDAPAVAVFAPGRVNLLGEHTDYNGGYVLPLALRDLGVTVAAGPGTEPGMIKVRSENFEETVTRQIGETRSGNWSDYLLGCAALIARQQIEQSGIRLTVETTLPLGAGLSSSAALMVAAARAMDQLFGLEMSPVEIAKAAQAAENDFVGLPCGIMDQFASSVGEAGQALFLDTRSLDYKSAPRLPGYDFVVVDSGVRHQLTDSGYVTRVEECQAACRALGVEMLSDLGEDDLDRIDAIEEPLNRRARHVVTDNSLVRAGLDALRAGQPETFGRIMSESHATERDNFQITVPETDALVAASVAAGALGARQTGGGWGGAVVALVPSIDHATWCATVTRQCPEARVLVVA